MTAAGPELPDGVRRVREEPVDGAVPLFVFGGWTEAFPWLVHGTTGRGDEHFDLGLFGPTPVTESMARWRALRESTGMPRAVHGRQVHGRVVMEHGADAPGLFITEGVDGHLTDRSGVLLTVAVADCVPVSVVDGDRRKVALLHAGWRGTSAGVVGAGLQRLGGDAGGLHAHLGPAICGECYEVGPEVHEALGLPVPETNRPVDVRAVLAGQLVAAGLSADRITVSEHCTRCGDGFFSHRGGSRGRQVGVLGMR